jgi:hypothetical protein
MSFDAAVLGDSTAGVGYRIGYGRAGWWAGRVWRLPEFNEIILAHKALPALRRHPWRIDAAGG